MPRDKHGLRISEQLDTTLYNARKFRQQLRAQRQGDACDFDPDCPFVKVWLHVQAERAKMQAQQALVNTS